MLQLAILVNLSKLPSLCKPECAYNIFGHLIGQWITFGSTVWSVIIPGSMSPGTRGELSHLLYPQYRSAA